jgi:hypothetical protein
MSDPRYDEWLDEIIEGERLRNDDLVEREHMRYDDQGVVEDFFLFKKGES